MNRKAQTSGPEGAWESEMNIWFGWTKIYIDDNGYHSEEVTGWKASAFILFTHVIFIGKVEKS